MANKTYNDHPTDNTPAADDLIPYWDVASSAAKKATRAKIVGATITGDGAIDTGGETLTVPATGTAALRNAANTFTANQTVDGAIISSSRVQAQGFRTEQITVASNGVYSFTPLTTTGMLLLNSNSGGTPRQNTQALISYRNASGVGAWCMILAQTSTYVETSTSELTGTTGTMNKVTVSAVAADGKLYIENRTDAAISINITMFG